MKKCAFLDRDGIINTDKGYIGKYEDIEYTPEIFNLCRFLQKNGYEIIIITNQSGVARGYYSEEDFHSLTVEMLTRFDREGVSILDVYACFHHPEKGLGDYKMKCPCRKPAPGMIFAAADQHSLNLEESMMIGDKYSDIEAAENAGVGTTYLINSEYVDSADFDSIAALYEHLKVKTAEKA